jgi:hypothetical protein
MEEQNPTDAPLSWAGIRKLTFLPLTKTVSFSWPSFPQCIWLSRKLATTLFLFSCLCPYFSLLRTRIPWIHVARLCQLPRWYEFLYIVPYTIRIKRILCLYLIPSFVFITVRHMGEVDRSLDVAGCIMKQRRDLRTTMLLVSWGPPWISLRPFPLSAASCPASLGFYSVPISAAGP